MFLSETDAYEIGGKILCEDCAYARDKFRGAYSIVFSGKGNEKRVLGYCDECLNDFSIGDKVFVVNGMCLCEKCLDKEGLAVCDVCSRIDKKSHILKYKGKKYCGRCLFERFGKKD
jgi:hypothetical protein